jgi:hypothetical protein
MVSNADPISFDAWNESLAETNSIRESRAHGSIDIQDLGKCIQSYRRAANSMYWTWVCVS